MDMGWRKWALAADRIYNYFDTTDLDKLFDEVKIRKKQNLKPAAPQVIG